MSEATNPISTLSGRSVASRRPSTSLALCAFKEAELARASRLSLSLMMDYTDRHFRHLFRLPTNRTLMYSEMVAANGIAPEYRNGDEDVCDWHMRRYLSQSLRENLSVLQLEIGADGKQGSGDFMLSLVALWPLF